MDKDKHKPPDYFELESLRSKLKENINNSASSTLKVLYYFDFFRTALQYNDHRINEAFLAEFMEDYFHVIKNYNVRGIDPYLSEKLISQFEYLSEIKIIPENESSIKLQSERLKNEFTNLKNILEGSEYHSDKSFSYFPLIIENAPEGFYGIIESMSVRISKSDQENRFIIIPSEKEIETEIAMQIDTAWELAIGIVKKYVRRPYKFHEVIINFTKKEGFYEGASLGIALTLSFVEELLKFYNPAYKILIGKQCAFTGGVNREGEILQTGEDIIKLKLTALFYSDISIFVFPKSEESYASRELKMLKEKFPDRKLKLIPAEEISDVLNRRDLIEITKINPALRAAKFVRRNGISAVLVVLLALIFGYLFVMDWDDNPAGFSIDGQTLYIKNSNGKVLLSKQVDIHDYFLTEDKLTRKFVQLIDVNNDNTNEILLVSTYQSASDTMNTKSAVQCLNSEGRIMWEYSFKDVVYSEREFLQPLYDVYLIDTATVNNRRIIYCYANNSTSFSSAVFGLDMQTGNRITDVQWNSGHTYDGIISGSVSNNERVFMGAGVDNGYRNGVVWVLPLDQLTGYRPTTPEYQIKNFSPAKPIFYIRIPKSDFEIYIGAKNSGILSGSLFHNTNDNTIRFSSSTNIDAWDTKPIVCFHYLIDLNLNSAELKVTDSFSLLRDSLVANGKLDYPLTDTKEYIEMQKNKLLFWKEDKWVEEKNK